MIKEKYLAIQNCMIHTVVFDFDGTLARLNIDFNQMRHVILELIAQYGMPQNNFKHLFVLEMIHEADIILNKGLSNTPSTFKKEAMNLIEDIELQAAQRGELFPSTKDLLQMLKDRSIRPGVITRNCSRAVRTVFPDIDSYCSVVLCRDDVDYVKPHPAQLSHALKQLNGIARSAIIVGDHPIDIETGRKVGTLTAGVLTGHFREEDFLQAGATIILPQASHILKY